jgi:hypothetical protein
VQQRVETNTFAGNSPIVTIGKNELGDITVSGVYTETDSANDIFDLLEAAFDAMSRSRSMMKRSS